MITAPSGHRIRLTGRLVPTRGHCTNLRRSGDRAPVTHLLWVHAHPGTDPGHGPGGHPAQRLWTARGLERRPRTAAGHHPGPRPRRTSARCTPTPASWLRTPRARPCSKDRPPPGAGRRQRRWRRHLPAGCGGAVQREVVDGGRPHGRRPLRRHQAQRRAHVSPTSRPTCSPVPTEKYLDDDFTWSVGGGIAFRGEGAGLPEEAAAPKVPVTKPPSPRPLPTPTTASRPRARPATRSPTRCCAACRRSARSVERSPTRAARWCAPTASGGRWPSRPR